MKPSSSFSPIRVGAVSYLNTVPLIYGMLDGLSAGRVHLEFSIPSECARQVEEGRVDIGLVPVVEIARQGLEIVPGVGIAARGPVRSILLFSRVPWREVRTLAADHGSRTSVQLARIILRERFSAEPEIVEHPPELDAMLRVADAALVIGDPALRLEPDDLPYAWLDLASEWVSLTGLPFVFAAWAGKPGLPLRILSELTIASYEYGKARIGEIVRIEAGNRRIPEALADDYLRHHLWYELGPREHAGLAEFLKLLSDRPATHGAEGWQEAGSLTELETDLVELGMFADAERQRRNPGGIITYCLGPGSVCNREVVDLRASSGTIFDHSPQTNSVTPICPPGATATDYLRLVALCRLHSGTEHIHVDVEWTGLKLAQVALRFGADDLANEKPGSQITEEDIRRVIREAGFVPKKRDREFRSLSVY